MARPPTPDGGAFSLASDAVPSASTERDIVATLFILHELLTKQRPAESEVILRVMSDAVHLRCFVDNCGGEATAAAQLVLSYASWCAAGLCPSSDPRPLTAGGVPLVDILPDAEGSDDRPAVAVLRDPQVLGRLLDQFSFDEVLRSHVAKLEQLLRSSPAARRHGVALVQDLRSLGFALVTRMGSPRMALPQARAARFLLGAFPCKWPSMVIVDAPWFFGGLWRGVSPLFPPEIAGAVRFLYRPDAGRQLEELFGRPIL